MRHTGTRTPILIATLAAALLGTASCTHDPAGRRVDNIPPHIRLTGGPLEGMRDSYRTRIYWTGWDDDGTVVLYQFAVDPPVVFTAEEIAAPETAPGLTLRTFRGSEVGTDTLRVSKTVDGAEHAFDYVQTREADVVILFGTPDPDSAYVGAHLRPKETASGAHTFYVRCLDNEGAWSGVDRVGFTAWSLTPTGYIVSPHTRSRNVLHVGETLHVSWSGFDPDSPYADARPVAYLYKLVNLRSVDQTLSAYREFDVGDLVYRRAADVPWIRQSADTAYVDLLLTPGDYVFAVRAVDATGAAEPFLEFNRPDQPGNCFKFVSFKGGGTPDITLTEATLGSFQFSVSSLEHEVEIPAGTQLRFSWSATASLYGGTIASFSFGIDVPDLDVEGPRSGWSPWGGMTSPPVPIVFRKPGYHVFYIRARDQAGNVQIGAFKMKVFDTPLDRDLLIVDDYRDVTNPTDARHDQFWNEMVFNSGRFRSEDMDPDILWYETGGASDKYYLTNTPPRLSLLGRYRLVIWNLHGDGWCGYTSFLQAAVLAPTLRSYLEVGGKLWLSGKLTLASTLRAELDCNDPRSPFYTRGAPTLPTADVEYPHAFEPGDFAYDIFRLATGADANDKGVIWEHGMLGVTPWDPAEPVLPEMRVDGGKFSRAYWELHALEFCDAIAEPIFTDGSLPHAGVLDSLYRYVAATPERSTKRWVYRDSEYNNRLCATRWHDPAPDRVQGRVMWFGFPLYYMYQNQAQETFNRAIDWFREETPAPRPED